MKPVVVLAHGFQAEYEIGFCNGLARRGLPVTLIGSDTTIANRAALGVSIINLRGSQAPDRLPFIKGWNMLRYLVRFLLLVFARRGAPVHVIGEFYPRIGALNTVAAWLTRLAAGRFILTFHNVLPHGRHTTVNHWLNWMTLRAAARVVVHTEHMAEAVVKRYGVVRDLITVMEHGIDRPLMPDADLRARTRTRLGLPENARVVLFFGKLEYYKGPDLLVEAFREAGVDPCVWLLIAGRCSDAALRANLRAAIESHPWRNRIVWRDGYVDDDDVPGLLLAADCMALPHRHVDQSGVLFAALAAGLPFVASDVGVFAAHKRRDVDEVVPRLSIEAFSAGLKRCLQRPAVERARMIEMAIARWDWRETVAPVLDLYEELWPSSSGSERPI